MPAPSSDPNRKPRLDLGDFRAAVSLDGDRLAYLARAPGSAVLLFTVVSLPEGRRVTDFLLLEESDQKRARGLLETGGYRGAEPLPEGLEVSVTFGAQGVMVERGGPGGESLLELGVFFATAAQAIPAARPRVIGASPGNAWVIVGVHAGAASTGAWPRTVFGVALRSPSPALARPPSQEESASGSPGHR